MRVTKNGGEGGAGSHVTHKEGADLQGGDRIEETSSADKPKGSWVSSVDEKCPFVHYCRRDRTILYEAGLPVLVCFQQ